MFSAALYARARNLPLIAHGIAGAARIRHSLRPLIREGEEISSKTRAHRAARSRTHAPLSSPGLTGRPSIPETSVIESISRGVLDHPLEPVIGRRFAPARWRAMTAECEAAMPPHEVRIPTRN